MALADFVRRPLPPTGLATWRSVTQLEMPNRMPTDIDEYHSGGASAASARLELRRGLAASRPHHRELLQDRGNFFERGEAFA
jgi:hypothetical protein